MHCGGGMIMYVRRLPVQIIYSYIMLIKAVGLEHWKETDANWIIWREK